MMLYWFCSEPMVEMEAIVRHEGRVCFLGQCHEDAPWSSYVVYPYGQSGLEADIEMKEAT